MINNGHTLQATPQPGGANTITLDGETFTLAQFHVHTPSEHIRLYAPINPARLLPDHSRVVHYTGSLTTPPCTEGVLWNIEMEPQTISRQQLDALRSVFPHKARPIQSFNKRALIDEPAAP